MKHLCCALLGCVLGLAACSQSDGKGQGVEGTGQTGMALATAVDEGGSKTDVAVMQYDISRVACVDREKFDPLHRTASVRLVDMMLPGGISAFENSPLDKSSAHPFSDDFEVLPVGCYNVRAAPLAAGGGASADCSPAWANGTLVKNGLTTEVFLISQCKGVETGAIDAAVALNQPPELTGLTFKPSKFIEKGQSVEICASAQDPNGDPLQFAWAHVDTLACGTPVVVSNLGSSECVSITPTKEGGYTFEVTVYDMIHDESGALIRIEDWLRQHGYPNDSHASLQFPIYVGAASAATQ